MKTSRFGCETASRLMRDDCCVAVILWGRDSRGVMEGKGREQERRQQKQMKKRSVE